MCLQLLSSLRLFRHYRNVHCAFIKVFTMVQVIIFYIIWQSSAFVILSYTLLSCWLIAIPRHESIKHHKSSWGRGYGGHFVKLFGDYGFSRTRAVKGETRLALIDRPIDPLPPEAGLYCETYPYQQGGVCSFKRLWNTKVIISRIACLSLPTMWHLITKMLPNHQLCIVFLIYNTNLHFVQ